MTSNAPGSGTSISSSWKASFGSPWRSSRITQAAIVSGSVPGSTSSSDTLVMSTAMGEQITRRGEPWALSGGDRLGGRLDLPRRVRLLGRLGRDQPEGEQHTEGRHTG